MMRVAAAVIEDGPRVLVTRRKPGGRFGGLWEFPGGKIESGEAPETALAREIREELGLKIAVRDFVGRFPFLAAEAPFELLAYRASVQAGEIGLADHDLYRWMRPDELDPSGFAPADIPVVEALRGSRIGSEAVVLRPGKEKAVRRRHHWIFSGAVGAHPDFENGAILPVRDADGNLLGHGYFNRKSSIFGRMLGFDETPPFEALSDSLRRAVDMRRRLVEPETEAFRVVNGEGDGVPGLIADKYADVLVLQVSTLGMERLKPAVVESLKTLLAPRTILERSNLPTRKEEGLAPAEGCLCGEDVEAVEIAENGLRFRVEFGASQKTGFYLDQRENRSLVRFRASGRRVLNAFSYSGGFTVAALAGGAGGVDSVDISEKAIALARTNCRLNGYESPDLGFFAADVFDFLRTRDLSTYDFIILDPPAFAKRKTEVVGACRGYKDVHRLVFRGAPRGALVLTFSCSYFVDENLFRQVIFQGAAEAKRRVRILQRHRQASDHPVNIYHPEGDYLKGFLLYVD